MSIILILLGVALLMGVIIGVAVFVLMRSKPGDERR